ncbi:hypothetical protein PN36_26855 [Candidatus Thiomargarita nelsonii]|uniref:Uncharacterized protein n=1 Tax=Candidatus Thiomargarita nelsonii TaxID=1003181 RepID=A0A0A6P9F8_9GAMM|nr:hypothetical protein PN36_26855 [Candidatus Thiomargarita nelsonii]
MILYLLSNLKQLMHPTSLPEQVCNLLRNVYDRISLVAIAFQINILVGVQDLSRKSKINLGLLFSEIL